MTPIRLNDTGLLSIGPAVSITDGFTAVTSLTLSGADSAAAKLGDDSIVDISGYTWAASSGMDSEYALTLQTGITDTVGPMVITIEDVSLNLIIREKFFVFTTDVYDALYGALAKGFSATATLTLAEMAQGAPTATPTEREVMNYLYREYVLNTVRVRKDGTNFKEVMNNAGSAALYKKAHAVASDILTVTKAVSGP